MSTVSLQPSLRMRCGCVKIVTAFLRRRQRERPERREEMRGMDESYKSFAQVYDLFMDNIDYSGWCRYLTELLREYQVTEGLVLELGCGTGTMTRLLAGEGYDMIGVDNSQEMLEAAAAKRQPQDPDILYLLQDMREFELYGTVKAAVSICDSLNYILEEEELKQVFRLVNRYLDPDGIFIFDMNTRYKYQEVIGETTIAENREEGSFIWENYFDEASDINEYELTLFLPDGGGRYRKYQELHYQRAYSPEQIVRLLEEAGMKFVAMYDAFTRQPVNEKSERICVVARESGKKKQQEETEKRRQNI